MIRQPTRKFDIYAELLLASSAMIMGLGVLAIALDLIPSGIMCVMAGIGLGVLNALHKMPVVTQKKLAR